MSDLLDENSIQYEFSVQVLFISDSQPKKKPTASVHDDIYEDHENQNYHDIFLRQGLSQRNDQVVEEKQIDEELDQHCSQKEVKKPQPKKRGRKKKNNFTSAQENSHNSRSEDYCCQNDEDYTPSQKKKQKRKASNKKYNNQDCSYSKERTSHKNLKSVSRCSLDIVEKYQLLTRDQLLDCLCQALNQRSREKVKRRSYDAINVMLALKVIYSVRVTRQNSKATECLIFSKNFFENLSSQAQQEVKKAQKFKDKKLEADCQTQMLEKKKKGRKTNSKKESFYRKRKQAEQSDGERAEASLERSREKKRSSFLSAVSKFWKQKPQSRFCKKQITTPMSFLQAQENSEMPIIPSKKALITKIQQKRQQLRRKRQANQAIKHKIEIYKQFLRRNKKKQAPHCNSEKIEFPLTYMLASKEIEIGRRDDGEGESVMVRVPWIGQLGGDVDICSLYWKHKKNKRRETIKEQVIEQNFFPQKQMDEQLYFF